MGEPVRLQRYLASCGVAARRKAEELITAGRVMVNGEVVTVLGTKIDPDEDAVSVDGEAVVANELFYVLFNKPKACITAVTDDRGRPTVMDYLPNLPVPVKPVGRLDFYSEGVLLLTNDGELASKLLAPASHVSKTYHVKVHGQVTREDLLTLRGGIMLDDGSTTMPADVTILPGESKYTWLAITIHEGKHRQIHRMLEARGYSVDKLQRVAFANLTFHNLRIGDARELTQTELNELRTLAGLDHSAVARGVWRVDREATDIPRRAKTKARLEAEDAANAPPDFDSDGEEPFEDDDDGADSDAAEVDDGRGPGPAVPARSRAAAGTREPTNAIAAARGGRSMAGGGPRTAGSGQRAAGSGPRAASSGQRTADSGRPRAVGTRDGSRPRSAESSDAPRGERPRGGFGASRDRGSGPRAPGARSFGSSRDGGSARGGFGGSRDGGGARGGFSDGGAARSPGGPRSSGSFGARGPRDADGESRGGYGGAHDARGGAPRGGSRDGAPRGGSRDGAPRGGSRDGAPRGGSRDGAPRGGSGGARGGGGGARGDSPERGAYGGARDARAGGRAPGGPTGRNYGTTRPAKGTTDRGRSFSNAGASRDERPAPSSRSPRGPRSGSGAARTTAGSRAPRSAPPRGRSTGPKRGR